MKQELKKKQTYEEILNSRYFKKAEVVKMYMILLKEYAKIVTLIERGLIK